MSGIIPRTFIDDLITRVDIVDLIDSYVPLKRAGKNFSACCPFHQEKTPSFNVSQSKQFYHCFGCGVSGNVISFMMNYRSLEFREAIEELASRVGIPVPYENTGHTQKTPPSQDLYTLLLQVTQYYQKQLSQSSLAQAYIQKRQLSDEIIKSYQIGYAPAGWENLKKTFVSHEKELIATGLLIERPQNNSTYDQYRDRIIFPIHDRRGRIIGFGGRVLDNQQLPKYINSPETTLFHKSKALYGLHQAAHNNPQPSYLFIVEGYMDVIAMAQHGISQVVATLGTATTRDHIQSLLRYTKQLIFCFDGDNAGRKAAWKALESALPYLDAQAQFLFLFLPDGEDPDTLISKEGQTAFLSRIPNAKSLDNFFFEELTKHLNLSQMADCSKLIESSKTYFALIPNCAYRSLLLEQLARFSRINVASIEKQFSVTHSQTSIKTSTPELAKAQRTNIRIALSLLIQQPELIEKITPILSSIELSTFHTIRGGKMLSEIIHVLQQESIRTTGQLLEYYRDHEYFPWITQLAIFAHNVPIDGIETEFSGAIKQLQQEIRDKEIKTLLQRKQFSDFSAQEQQQLLVMLKRNKLKS